MQGALYRRTNGWVAIVKPADEGCQLSMFRTERTVEDVLAVANEAVARCAATATV